MSHEVCEEGKRRKESRRGGSGKEAIERLFRSIRKFGYKWSIARGIEGYFGEGRVS